MTALTTYITTQLLNIIMQYSRNLGTANTMMHDGRAAHFDWVAILWSPSTPMWFSWRASGLVSRSSPTAQRGCAVHSLNLGAFGSQSLTDLSNADESV
jgi:hypothetical protein